MSPESSLNLQGGRFEKGQSGNPKSKPKGAGNWTTIIKLFSVLAAKLREGITPSEAGTVINLAKVFASRLRWRNWNSVSEHSKKKRNRGICRKVFLRV